MAEPERSSDVASYVDNYDVFINFRGEDTRLGFVRILYDDLIAEGMRVFLDDEELNYGRRLDEELPQAINNSKIYITVLSQTYATSTWCLRELAQIVRNEQQYKDKKEILPVFYKIKTADVKLSTDLFKNQLNHLIIKKKATAETVEEWGAALMDIPHHKAWKVPINVDGGYKQDKELSRKIVKRASILLRVKHKPLPKDVVGIENPVEEVMRLLDIENPGLRIIGILGMGGSGKTTLAKAVYNKLCNDGKFECYCFMPDVRESLDEEKGRRGRLELQKKLLKEVSYRGEVDDIRESDEAIRKIQLALKEKKVLMVFDDVSKADQIVRLTGQGIINNFNRGSRIIITTRDDRVLRNREFAKFTNIHEMKAMENEHAVELFSWHAFGQQTPPEEFSLLSSDAVSLTGQLPLSLEIIGSLFFVGGRKNWKLTVEKLKKRPNVDVHERLKISYEDLEEETKEIFLDIACFFVDKKRSHEFHMWDACGFFPELAIEELISMCLIKIEKGGDKYWMHDHIKDLGRDIVRQEGPKDKEQRSRIWKTHDAMDILTTRRKRENNKIEGIFLEDLRDGDDEIWTLRGENCVNLHSLRFLHYEVSMFPKPVFDVQVEGSFEHLLPNLRWLSLQYVKMKLFNATNFNLKKLVVLNLSWSDITESWAGWKEFKDLPSLQVLNLNYCQGLKRTPDLSFCTSLKKLLLSNCSNLEEIDDSITSLPKLSHLDLSYCMTLKKLSDSIGELMELEVLLLHCCTSLVSVPNSLTSLPKLHILRLSVCMSLENLPDSVGEMVQLTELDISHSALKKLPRFVSKQKRLELLRADMFSMQGVPTDIEGLTHLREISFDGSSICELPSLVKLTRLEKLSLRDCNHLQQLPAELPTSLVQLHVSSTSLQSSPDYSYLINLTDLQLDLIGGYGKYAWLVATELHELNVNWIWRLSKLKKLELSMPRNSATTIQSEESSSVSLTSQLEQINLRCSALGACAIPSFLSTLSILEISLYRETTSLTLPRLNRLTHFSLSNSGDLTQILGLGELESLISLKIKECDSLERLEDISKLRRLLILEISWCKKLRVISVIPCLPSLKELVINGCDSVESLVGPSVSESQTESCLGDLHLVEHLQIVRCPLLENKLPDDLTRCTGKYKEEDWEEEEDADDDKVVGKEEDDDEVVENEDDDDDGDEVVVEEKEKDDEVVKLEEDDEVVVEKEDDDGGDELVVEEEGDDDDDDEAVVVVDEEDDDEAGPPNALRFMGVLALLLFFLCLGFRAGSWRMRRFLH